MQQLKGKDLYKLLNNLKRKGIKLENVNVYIGNDEELNGIHTAFFCQCIEDEKDEDEKQYYIDLINQDYANIKYDKEKYNIMIS